MLWIKDLNAVLDCLFQYLYSDIKFVGISKILAKLWRFENNQYWLATSGGRVPVEAILMVVALQLIQMS